MRISDWSSDVCSSDLVDLVLLDMVMPGLTGLHVLAEIRASRETADLPVIMLTGHNDAAAAVEALATGADDLLAKPVAVDLLAEIGRASCRDRVCQYV